MRMSVPHYVLNNLGWKMLSLLAATLIWLTIHSSIQGNVKAVSNTSAPETIVTNRLTLPIIVATAATEVRSFRINPHAVEVALSGDDDVVLKLKPSDVDAFVNLIDITGARQLRKKVQIRTPPGVSIVSVEPAEVSVESLPATPESVQQQSQNP